MLTLDLKMLVEGVFTFNTAQQIKLMTILDTQRTIFYCYLKKKNIQHYPVRFFSDKKNCFVKMGSVELVEQLIVFVCLTFHTPQWFKAARALN